MFKVGDTAIPTSHNFVGKVGLVVHINRRSPCSHLVRFDPADVGSRPFGGNVGHDGNGIGGFRISTTDKNYWWFEPRYLSEPAEGPW